MPVMPIYLKAVSYDSSGSARIRIFGSIETYTVHYIRESEISVNKQICPKSIQTELSCAFCSKWEETRDSQVSTYNRLMCIAWDFSSKKWACFNGSEGLFREIKNLFSEKKFSKTEIMEGKTSDVILQRIGSKTTAALIEDSLGKTDKDIKKPVPTQGDLDRFGEKVASNSIWFSTTYADAIRMAARQKRDREREQNEGLDFISRAPSPFSPEARQQSMGRIISDEDIASLLNRSQIRRQPTGDLTPIPDGALLIYQRPVYRDENDEETPPKPTPKKSSKPKFKPDLPQRNTDAWDII